MTNNELARARTELHAIGADWALLTSAENVTYVSHFEVPVEFGPLAQLNFGPVMAFFSVNESPTLMLANSAYAGAACRQGAFDEVIGFDILEVFEPFAPQVTRDNFIAGLRQMLQQAQLGNRKLKVAVEERTLPLVAQRLLQEMLPNVEWIEAGGALSRARMLKTAREVALLKRTADVVNVAHKKLMEVTRQAGMSEFAIWAELTKAMHEDVGGKLFIAGEVVCGPRNKTVSPGGPIDYVTKPGDVAELDISPRYQGYWADMANTMIIGAEPTAVQKEYARAARESFYAGVNKARPGNKASDIFDAAANAYTKYGLKLGHYAGHGIGATVNEAPWFVPSDHTVLEAGMVICIETGAYSEAAAGKCEKMMLIQPSGDPDIFPDFEWGTPL